MRRRVFLAIVILGAAWLTGGTGAVAAETEPIPLKLATHWPVLHDMNNVMVEFARDIGRESKGRIKVTYFPAGTLAGSGEKYQKLRAGVCDIANIHLSQHPGAFPLAQLTTLPFLFSDGTEASWVLNRMLDAFSSNLEAQNIKLLFMVGDPNFQILLSKKKVETPEDFKGLRLKCGGFADEALKLWGAVPVQLKHGDMYLALRRSVVDGIVFPVGAARSFKLEEVSRYVFKLDLFSYHLFMGMNLDTWKRLPEDLQKGVERASLKAAYLSGFHYQDTDAATFSYLASKGLEVYEPTSEQLDALKSSVRPLREKLVQDLEEEGLPAKETLARMETLMAEYRLWSDTDALKPTYR